MATIRCEPPVSAADVLVNDAVPPERFADPSTTTGVREVSVKVTVPRGVMVAEVTLAVRVMLVGLFGGVVKLDESTVQVGDALMVAVVVVLVLNE